MATEDQIKAAARKVAAAILENIDGLVLEQARERINTVACLLGISMGLSPKAMGGVLVIVAMELFKRADLNDSQIAILVRGLCAPIPRTVEDELKSLEEFRKLAAKHGIVA